MLKSEVKSYDYDKRCAHVEVSSTFERTEDICERVQLAVELEALFKIICDKYGEVATDVLDNMINKLGER